MKYNLVVCGGTFDRLHKGHREFLKYGLSLGEKLLVGVTSDKYLKKSKIKNQKSKIIESFETREKNLEKFFIKNNALDRVEIQPIDDIYVPKIWEELPIEAIIVSKNTISGAKRINIKRQEQKKYPLKIEIIKLVKNENNEYISSSKIRKGEMDREGKPYISSLWLKYDLKITEALRRKLKKPFGTLIKNQLSSRPKERSDKRRDPFNQPLWNEIPRQARNDTFTENPYVITVGDVATKTFNDLGVNQDISVIDFCVARKRVFSKINELGFLGKEKVIKVVNPPGYLTADFFSSVKRLFSIEERVIILVDGEEDLSVLPLVLGSPLGSLIFYGQPQEGIVRVEVSEETKNKVYSIVSKFSVCTRGY